MPLSGDAQAAFNQALLFVACRVTPKGCKPVEANTATKAWSALFTSQDSARALGYSGAKQFGLQHPCVQRLLQGMPGAARCERYAAWPGQPPPVFHLVGLNSNIQACHKCVCVWVCVWVSVTGSLVYRPPPSASGVVL